jgi:hypothetical protein
VRGQYIPFEGDPLMYAMGPGHLFFGQQGVGSPTPNAPPGTSPLENPATAPLPQSPLEGRSSEFAAGDVTEFDNPNISHNPMWGQAVTGLAGLLGGPLGSAAAGGLMGATMAQEIAQEYGSRGFGTPAGVPGIGGGALQGGMRGALGTLGGIAGLTPGWSAMQEAYAGIPGIQGANDWGGVVAAIAENPRGALSGYTVAGLAPEELGGMGGGKGDGSWGDLGEGSHAGAGSDKGDAPSSDSIGDASTDSKRAGGLVKLAQGGLVGIRELAGGGKIVTGPGGGLDDLIPTTIDGRRAARLSDGEFVIPADVVSMFGDGSSRAGSQKLYDLVKGVRREKTGTTRQAGQLPVGRILERVFG